MFEKISIVLSHPTHPGNIGSAARAMKTMGFGQLVLINPSEYPSAIATSMASGAHDVLKEALVVDNLNDALKPFQYIIGASARHRTLQWPLIHSNELGPDVQNALSAQPGARAAIMFGTESSGLTNEELRACNKHVYIPSNPEYGSLNLSQAVQVLCYELRMHLLKDDQVDPQDHEERASFEQVEGFYEHLQQSLGALGILNPEQPRQLMGRFRRLFAKAELTPIEINMLRGMLKATISQCKNTHENT